MRSFDFAPLFRSTVGFDRIFDLLEDDGRLSNVVSWPPYDIVKTGDDSYRIVMAVAGYSHDELNVVAEPNMLVVAGYKQAPQNGTQLLHQGLANGGFERRFELADYVKVSNASLENGLLTIELVRELPEAMKPRRIEIQAQALPNESEPRRVGQSAERAAA